MHGPPILKTTSQLMCDALPMSPLFRPQVTGSITTSSPPAQRLSIEVESLAAVETATRGIPRAWSSATLTYSTLTRLPSGRGKSRMPRAHLRLHRTQAVYQQWAATCSGRLITGPPAEHHALIRQAPPRVPPRVSRNDSQAALARSRTPPSIAVQSPKASACLLVLDLPAPGAARGTSTWQVVVISPTFHCMNWVKPSTSRATRPSDPSVITAWHPSEIGSAILSELVAGSRG